MAVVDVDPGENPQTAIDANPAGTEIRFTDGVHRQVQCSPKQGNIFSQTGGAVLNGSRDLTAAGWVADGGNWKLTGATWGTFIANSNCQTGYRCRCTEDLYFDNVLMQHVDAFADPLGSGNYFFDYDTDTIYVGDNPAGATLIEQCDKDYAIGGPTADVTDVVVNGIVIDKYASRVQFGAIGSYHTPVYMGNGWQIKAEVRRCHGRGISVAGTGWRVYDSILGAMGQLGIGGAGTGTFEDSEIYGCNTALLNGWEAGGCKFAYTNNLIMRRIYSHDNLWDGLWCDIDNIDASIEYCTVVNNKNHGIYYEISYAAIIRRNFIAGNGANGAATSWGPCGISVHSSPNVEIYENILFHNHNSIVGKLQDRGAGAYGDYKITNLNVHDNWTYQTTGNPTAGHNGITGVVSDYGGEPVLTGYGIFFDNNHYRLGDADNHFDWGSEMGFAAWQAAANGRDTGNDTRSTGLMVLA